jgi:hypothetical protein
MNGDNDLPEPLDLKSSSTASTEKKDIVSQVLGELVAGVREQRYGYGFFRENIEVIGRSNCLWIVKPGWTNLPSRLKGKTD